MCGPRLALAIRLGYAGLGIVVGLAVCAVFRVSFHNPQAGNWGLVSAAAATITFLVFLYLYALRPPTRPPSSAILLTSGILAALGAGAGVGGFATYLGLGIINTIHGDDRPLFETEYIVCVWTFMTFKWSITTFFYSTKSYYNTKTIRRNFIQ